MRNIEKAGSIQLEENIINPTQYRLDFGRYKGYALREIYRTDPMYVRKLAKERPQIQYLTEGLQMLENEPVRSDQVGLIATTLFLLLIIVIALVVIVNVI
jgi:hypothetical protein